MGNDPESQILKLINNNITELESPRESPMALTTHNPYSNSPIEKLSVWTVNYSNNGNKSTVKPLLLITIFLTTT